MSDVLTNNRKFRKFNVIDDYNRQAIAVEIARRLLATKITSLLACITKEQGKPKRIRTDNGPEFISKEFQDWCTRNGIELQYIQPGRPMKIGYIERFNCTFREYILVTAKLLTGFDAPILQNLYLDKSIKNVTLLQAICRTNRLYPN